MDRVKKNYQNAVQVLVEMASLQTSFLVLAAAAKQINRRVSAIKNIIIPRYENTIEYILNELDEQERGDFYRMKLVKTKKDKMRLEKEKLIQAEGIDEPSTKTIFDQFKEYLL